MKTLVFLLRGVESRRCRSGTQGCRAEIDNMGAHYLASARAVEVTSGVVLSHAGS